jgi:aquaporin Z
VRPYLSEFLGAFFLVFTFLSTSVAPSELAAFAVAAVVVAAMWAGAHLSGGHFNPAVTLATYLRRQLSLADLWSYWAAQLAGAFAAALLAMTAFPRLPDAVDVSGSAALPALLVEFLFTFAIVYVVLSIRVSPFQEQNVLYGVAVGAVVLVGSLTVGDVSGAAFNPAVAFGMTVDGGFAWPGIWVYLVAEVTGAVAATAVASFAVPASQRSAQPR